MAPSNVCPTDDAIQAFLEYLVFPMLPAKSSVRDNPTASQQQSVANQVSFITSLFLSTNYSYKLSNILPVVCSTLVKVIIIIFFLFVSFFFLFFPLLGEMLEMLIFRIIQLISFLERYSRC